jgi:hypothetical protein
MPNVKLLVVGRSSFVYSVIKKFLPLHDAVDYNDLRNFDFSRYYKIVILSFPKKLDASFEYLNILKMALSSTVPIVFISTFGLNGLTPKIINSYFYLKLKRECEILVLNAGGSVLRLGQVISDFNFKILGFISLPQLICDEIISIDRGELRSVGVFRPIKFGVLRIFASILAFANQFELVLIFKLAHFLGYASKFRGYSLLSNYYASQASSIGFGLSSINCINFSCCVFISPPVNASDEVLSVSNIPSYSKRMHGFGSRWHGVHSYLNGKTVHGFQSADLRTPLIPPGRFFFAVAKFLFFRVELDVRSYRLRHNYVEIDGVDRYGKRSVFVSRLSMLNAGIFQNISIISRSIEQDIPVVFSKQTLHHFPDNYPNDKDSLLASPGFFSHTKCAIHIVRGPISALMYFRPTYPFSFEIKLIFDSFLKKLLFVFSNISYPMIRWILYAKFGYLKSMRNLQLDIQLSRPLKGVFRYGAFTPTQLDLSASDLAKDFICIASNGGYLTRPPSIFELGDGMDALHLSLISIDNVRLSLTQKLDDGKVYFGPAGALVNNHSAFHNSTELLRPLFYTITID